MAHFLGQLEMFHNLTNFTRMMPQLLENESTIILQFIYATKVPKIHLIFEKKKRICQSRQNGHFSKFC